MVFLEPISIPLLFLHLVAAVAALGSAIHLLVRFVMALRGRPGLFRIKQMHAAILLVSYLAVVALGALVYPTFRVRVRYEYLDEALPWATKLFEIKEHAAALCILPVIGVYLCARLLDFRTPEDRRYVPLVMSFLVMVIATIVYNAVYGWYLGILRPL